MRTPAAIFAAVAVLVLLLLSATSDLFVSWETTLPGDAAFVLRPLFTADGTLEGGGVWLENDGPYTTHFPLVVLRTENTRSHDAYRVVCEVVEKHLHAPGSAHFAPFSSAKIGVADSESVFGIDAYVDAQDRLGASTRAEFRALLSLSSGGTWTVRQQRLSTTPENESMLIATTRESNS